MTPLRLSRYATLGGYFSLIIVLVLWYGFWSPTLVGMVIMLLPLLFPLRGLLQGKPYTHAWTSFLIMAYFIHGVVETYANETDRLWASLEILCSVITYLGAIFYARFRGRELKKAQQAVR